MESLMRQEIFSEPRVIRNTIKNCNKVIPEIIIAVKEQNVTHCCMMARGTSDNACTVFSYLLPILAGKVPSSIFPSTYTVYNCNLNLKNTLFIIVSQSGMSKDTIKVMHDAKRDGALVVGITNNLESDVAKESHFHIYLDVEEEKSVAATKTYIAELFALDMLAEALGGEINNDYEALADRINDVLDLDNEIKEIAEGIANENNFLILSRSSTLGSADELCLKLTECCYLFAKSFSSATFMHGPLSLLTTNTNLIMFAPNSKNTQEYIDMATRAKEKGANLIAFSDIPEVLSLASYKVKMPRTDMITAPVLYGVAASLLALNIGEAKGYNVDSPRNLNKVTVTL